MPPVSDREDLQGVGRTMLLLADGLVRDGFLDPGEKPTASEVFRELRDDLDSADGHNGPVVTNLPLLLLQVVRVAQLCGVRPTVEAGTSEAEVGVEIADVAGGLELLKQLPREQNLEIRGLAITISVLVDYAYVVVEPLLRESEEQLDIVKLVQGALAVAGIAARKGLDDTERGRVAVELLRRCADSIEVEVKADAADDAAAAAAASSIEAGEDGSDGG